MSETKLDGWVNIATGIGGPRDKSSGYAFQPSELAAHGGDALETLYEEDHIAARIVDAPVDAVFVDGWSVDLPSDTEREPVIDALDTLSVEDTLDTAMRWERLYGGAAIFMGVDDGRSFEEPIGTVRRLMYLHVFHRYELWPVRWYDDPREPGYGSPSHYRVTPHDVRGTDRSGGTIIHASRLIKFGGAKTTKRRLIENQYWGQSDLIRAYTAIKQYGGGLASVLALMSDASQGVYKLKGLTEIIQAGNGAAIQARMRAMDQVRSAMNAVLLDSDGEDYTRIATSLTELGALIDRLQLNVASAAVMPATEIFGRSAAGLNATGENDLRSWYKRIAQIQRQKARPALEQILRLLFRATAGPTYGQEPESWSVEFPPVWTPTAKEAAEIHSLKMGVAMQGLDAGAVTPEQIARGLFMGNDWNGEIVLTEEEISAIQGVAAAMGEGYAPEVGAPLADETLDAEGEEAATLTISEPMALVNARGLAQQMTEHGITRCEHGRPNRCPVCGIERARSVSIGADGQPAWSVEWRAIGEVSAPVEDTDDGETPEAG